MATSGFDGGGEAARPHIRDKIEDAVTKRFDPPSCVGSLVAFCSAITVAVIALCLSCTASCRPRLFRADPEKGVVMGPEDIPTDVLPLGAVPRSKHTVDARGALLRSTATGSGFAIEWTTPGVSGAVTEEVLDAVLSRWENLNRTGYGSDELSRHIFELDKLLEAMRQGGFSSTERQLGRVGRGGPPGTGNPSGGAGFPGPSIIDGPPGGFGSSPSDTPAEPTVEPETETQPPVPDQPTAADKID